MTEENKPTSLDVTPRIYFENDIAVMVELFHLYSNLGLSSIVRSVIMQDEKKYSHISRDDHLRIKGRDNQRKQYELPLEQLLGQNYRSVKSLLESQELRANYFQRTEVIE